jgi:polyhydroxyalkanoate synthesis regulator phasin
MEMATVIFSVIVIGLGILYWKYTQQVNDFLDGVVDDVEEVVEEVKEEVEEVIEEVKEEVEEAIEKLPSKSEIKKMSKDKIEELGRRFGIELDKRKTKDNMIKDLMDKV